MGLTCLHLVSRLELDCLHLLRRLELTCLPLVRRLELTCLHLVRRICQAWQKQTLWHQQGCLPSSQQQQQQHWKLRQKLLPKLCGPEG